MYVCLCACGVWREGHILIFVCTWGTLCGVDSSMGWEQAGSHWFCFLIVYARDGGSPPLLTHVTVRVAVEDENDHAPTFGSAHLSLEVPEGQDPQTLTTLRASDPDVGANGQLQYRILGENLPAPTCPGVLLVGLCQTQRARVSFSFSLCFCVSKHLFLCPSSSWSPLCLFLSFCFFSFLIVSPCRAVVLKLFRLRNP